MQRINHGLKWSLYDDSDKRIAAFAEANEVLHFKRNYPCELTVKYMGITITEDCDSSLYCLSEYEHFCREALRIETRAYHERKQWLEGEASYERDANVRMETKQPRAPKENPK